MTTRPAVMRPPAGASLEYAALSVAFHERLFAHTLRRVILWEWLVSKNNLQSIQPGVGLSRLTHPCSRMCRGRSCCRSRLRGPDNGKRAPSLRSNAFFFLNRRRSHGARLKLTMSLIALTTFDFPADLAATPATGSVDTKSTTPSRQRHASVCAVRQPLQ